MRLTNDELNTVRSPNQSTDLWLGVYEPHIVFEARITGSVSKGETDLQYYSVLTGTVGQINAGMTLYVGTTPDGDDIGRVRVRSASTGTIVVAEDKNIEYEVGHYITVRDYYEIWPMFPKATLGENNQISYYKDRDIAYSDQNENFNPTVVMGSNYFGFGDEYNSQLGIYFTATGSYVVDGTLLTGTYWTLPSGSSGGTYIHTGTDIGYINMPLVDDYTIKCRITAANNKESTGYRHICIYNRPGYGSKIPILDWELKDLSGSWEKGWTAKIEVGEGAYKFRDGYLVGIWADDYYNGVKQSIGGYKGREHILFIGYVNLADTFYNRYNSRTTFYLRGTVSILENKEMFSVSLEDNADPSDWTQLKNMTIKKILDHYLRWHTTLFNVADVENIKTSNGDLPEQYEDITKGEILSSINNLLNARLLSNFTSDKTGRCFAETDMNIIVTGSRPSSVMTFNDGDWINDPSFQEIQNTSVSNVLVGGVSYDFNTVSGSAYLSRAPGVLQTYSGKSDQFSGMTVESQDDINRISGLYFAKLNNKIPRFSQDTNFNMRNIDIVPQEFYSRNLLEDDTFKRTRWINKRFLPRAISYKYKNGSLMSSIEFEAESYGTPGETIEIPVTAPRTSRPRRVSVRTRTPQPPRQQSQGTGNLVYVCTSTRVARTRNFLATSPNWSSVWSGSNARDLIIDPYDPLNTAYLVTSSELFKTTNLNSAVPTWSSILTSTVAAAALSSSTGGAFYRGRAGMTQQGLLYFTFHCFNTAAGNDQAAAVIKTTTGGSSWVYNGQQISFLPQDLTFPEQSLRALDVSQWDGNFVLVGSTKAGTFDGIVWKSTNGGTTFSQWYDTGLQIIEDIHIPYQDNEDNRVVYVRTSDNNITTMSLRRTVNGGSSWSDITPSGYSNGQDFASLKGQRLTIHTYTQNRLTLFASNGQEVYYSSDGGNTWTEKIDLYSLSSFNYQGFGGFPYNEDMIEAVLAVENLSDNDYLIVCTMDRGNNWLDKTGDWISAIGSRTTTFAAGNNIIPIWVAG